jgi:O-acetyl-ADP-ribose deacetylase (regulator of RNase III)
MPIVYVEGNILESSASVLVNPVNCVGVMGAGLALQFKRKYPEMFKMYKKNCTMVSMDVGDVACFYETDAEQIIVNLATKRHWKEACSLEGMEKCVRTLRGILEASKPKSVALPKLGCGCGGLTWHKVRPIIENGLGGLDSEIFVYV